MKKVLMFINPNLIIKESKGKGRGVFTTETIAANTLIEISPVLVFAEKETPDAEKTLLYNYFFEWGKNRQKRVFIHSEIYILSILFDVSHNGC